MEDVSVKLALRLAVTSGLVQQGYLFEQQVVTFRHKLGILLQEREPLGVRTAYAAVQLVELHEHACVGVVKRESALHVLYGLVLIVQFVEVCQRQVAPNGREHCFSCMSAEFLPEHA